MGHERHWPLRSEGEGHAIFPFSSTFPLWTPSPLPSSPSQIRRNITPAINLIRGLVSSVAQAKFVERVKNVNVEYWTTCRRMFRPREAPVRSLFKNFTAIMALMINLWKKATIWTKKSEGERKVKLSLNGKDPHRFPFDPLFYRELGNFFRPQTLWYYRNGHIRYSSNPCSSCSSFPIFGSGELRVTW